MATTIRSTIRSTLRPVKMVHKGTRLNLSPEVKQYISGLTTPLSSEQVTKLDTRVKSLKTRLGVSLLSEIFDVLYLSAGETQESMLKNIAKDAHHGTSPAMPSFTAFKGPKGNGIDQYIDTNYNPKTQGVNYTKDSASEGFYISEQDSDTANHHFLSGTREGSVNYANIGNINTQLSFVFAHLNSGNVNISSVNVNPDNGLIITNRNDAATSSLWVNSEKINDFSMATSEVPDGNVYLLGRNFINQPLDSPTDARMSAYFRGRGLTPEQIAIITDEIEQYMISVSNAHLYKITSPKVIFSFDDGNYEHQTLTKTLFESKGKRCTHFVHTALVDTAGFLTNEGFMALHNAGFDMQCHTETTGIITELTEAQLLARYDAVNSFFTGNGLEAPKFTAYPGGVNDNKSRSITQKRRILGRGIGNNGKYHTGYLSKIYQLETAAALDGATGMPNSAKNAIDAAIANNALVIFYGHGIYETDPAESSYPSPMKLSALEETIDYAIAQGVEITTFSEVFAEL